MQNFKAFKETITISEKDVEAERFAFDLAAVFGINLAEPELVKKRLTGWPLYEYVVDAMVNGDACVEPLHQYAKLWRGSYGCIGGMEKKHE